MLIIEQVNVVTEQNLNQRWCPEVLLIRSKLKAISEASAESERMFSRMKRLKNYLSSRLKPSNIANRLQANAHLPRDPQQIDWQHALNLWKEKKERYSIRMNGTKKLKKRKCSRDYNCRYYKHPCVFTSQLSPISCQL